MTKRDQRALHEISFYRGIFEDVLSDWDIYWKGLGRRRAQCRIDPKRRQAVIADWHKGKPMPRDYILHEMLHICIGAVLAASSKKKMIKAEENLVSTLAGVISMLEKEAFKKHGRKR